MLRRFVLVLLLLSLALPALSQSQSIPNMVGGVLLHSRTYGDLAAAQRVLLSNYCRLDFDGARLQEGGWNRLKPYVAMHSNPDFTRVIVVSRYDVLIPEQPSQQIAVDYKTLGAYSFTDGYTTGGSAAPVTFHVQEQNSELLITGIDPPEPHVSARAALAWMNARLTDPKTGELEQAHLKDAIHQLSQQMAPRPAAQ